MMELEQELQGGVIKKRLTAPSTYIDRLLEAVFNDFTSLKEDSRQAHSANAQVSDYLLCKNCPLLSDSN
jgi:hypothetical protein